VETRDEIISLIKEHAKEAGRTPTIQMFADKHELFASSIVRKFGSWNELLKLSGLSLNKSNKRTSKELITWLKSHPDARYYEIPFGIRNRLEEEYGNISEARKAAGLLVTDWRTATKRRNYNKPINVGRPVEFTEEVIVKGLQVLAVELGRPPRIKDITKKKCGFTPSAIFARFGSLNAALQSASLPLIYSHHEQNKLFKELEVLMMNIKIALQDMPLFYNIEIENGTKPIFVYENRCEELILKRSEINSNIENIQKNLKKYNKIIVWFLVDDSLNDIEGVETICIMNLMDILQNKNNVLADKILSLRKQYDDISRKYIGQPLVLR